MKGIRGIVSILVAVLIVGFFGRAPAQAEDFHFEPYAGVAAGAFGLSTQGTSDKVFGGYLRFGAEITPYFAPEIRVGSAAKGSTSGFSEASMNWFVSYLARVQVPVNADVRLYGVFGGTTLRTSLTPTGGAQRKDTTTDFTFGGGLDYRLPNGLLAGAEWVRYAHGYDNVKKRRLDVWGIVGSLSVSF